MSAISPNEFDNGWVQVSPPSPPIHECKRKMSAENIRNTKSTRSPRSERTMYPLPVSAKRSNKFNNGS